MPANDLLLALFKDKPPGTFIEIQAHRDKNLTAQHFFRTLKELLVFLEQHSGDGNLFFGVCPRVRPRGSTDDVHSVPALWVDIDFAKSEAELYELPDDIPEPTFLIRSGSPKHLHLYWLLDTPAEPTLVTRNILAGLHFTLGADATHDLSRRMRIPGTYNYKTHPPRKCVIGSYNPENVYPLKRFAFLAEGTSRKEMIKLEEADTSVDIDSLHLSAQVRSLITEGKESRYAVRFERPDGTIDRSRLDMAIVSALHREDLTPEQIYGVFERYPCSGRYSTIRHRVPYLEHTISAAITKRQQTTITVDFTTSPKAQKVISALDPCPLPTGGWLKSYVEELDARTEAPASYHLHAGLSAIAATVGTKLLLPAEVYARYANIYVMLVGESGITGKSTAISFAREVVTTISPDYPVYGDFTTEALSKVFSEQPALLVCRGEMGAIAAASAKKYSSDIIPVLAELYDGDLTGRLRATVLSTKWKHPAVNVLLGTTITWLRKYMGLDIKEAVAGGFFPRFLIVLESDTGKAIPRSKGVRLVARELANNLYPLVKDIIAGDEQYPVTFDKQAAEMYDTWYITQRQKDVSMLESQASFFARLRTTAIKVAALIQVSVNGALEITPSTMQYALKLCDWHRRRLSRFLGTIDPLEEQVQKVANIIQSHGIATKTEIYRSMPGRKPAEVRDVLSLLVDREYVEQVNLRREGKQGRPATGFRWVSSSQTVTREQS